MIPPMERELRRIERKVRREDRMSKIGNRVVTGLGYVIAVLLLLCVIAGLVWLLDTTVRAVG